MSLHNDLETLKKKIKDQEKAPPPSPFCEEKTGYGSGIEVIAGFITAFGVVWGFGHVLTISYFWRIIIGTILAMAVNVLMVYRMRDK